MRCASLAAGDMMRSLALLFSLVLLVCILQPVAAQQSYCGIVSLFFQHNTTTNPPGYEELIGYPSGNTEVDESITIKNTDGLVLIDSYITPEGAFAHTSELQAGLRTYKMWHWVDTASGVTTANYSVYLRKSNGTEIFVYSAKSNDVDALVPTRYDTVYVKQVPTILEPTDRIVIKVYGGTTHPSPVVFHFVYQGSTRASLVESGYFTCEAEGAQQGAAIYMQPPLVPLPAAIPLLGLVLAVLVFARSRK